jgi:hypothetical protein
MRMLLVLAPLLAACVRTGPASDTTFTHTNKSPRPLHARAADSVEIYTTSKPTRPYIVVGLMRAIERAGPAWAIESMRARAAEIGCDGIVMTDALVTRNFSEMEQVHRNGTCFVYAEPAATSPGS